jgi:hypothetical protein
MSRILRRPMFRGGGKVDSYGTGITAPLVPGYMGGGQIGGGIIYGKPMADGRFGFQKPVLDLSMMPNSNVTSGLELLKRNKAIQEGNVPFTSYNIPKGVTQEKEGETTVKEEATPVVYDQNEDIGYNLFGEKDTTETITLPDGSTKQVLVQSEGPSPLVELNLGLIDRKEYEKKVRENKYKENEGKGRVFEGMEGEIIGDPRPDTEAVKISDGSGEDPNLNLEEKAEISAKDAIAENQKLFAELLGADKARGQDISDMLLRFSGSGGDTVGEKFKNYFRAESAAGPSRSEKIKQTAAGLAINDYVAGKRSDEQIQKLKEVETFRQGLKDDSLKLSVNDSLSMAKAKGAKLTDKGINSDETTKALIQTKVGDTVDVFRAKIKFKDVKNKKDKLKIGYNLVDDKDGTTRIVLYDGANIDVKGTIDEFWGS